MLVSLHPTSSSNCHAQKKKADKFASLLPDCEVHLSAETKGMNTVTVADLIYRIEARERQMININHPPPGMGVSSNNRQKQCCANRAKDTILRTERMFVSVDES